MIAPPFPAAAFDWPYDLRTDLRNCHLGCVVTGAVSGDASEDFTRETITHFEATSTPGVFLLGEEVGPRNLKLHFRSAGGLTVDGDDALVGCEIIDQSLTAIAGPFTVRFTLALATVNVITVDVPDQSRADIIAGVTATGTHTGPDYSADFSLSFS